MAKRNWADGVLGNTPLSAKRLNTLESDLSAALVALARDPESLFAGAVQYDANGAPTSAVVKWPDGLDGTYSGTPSVSQPGAVSAYTITRVVGGTTVTYTQPAITRDATTGNVTNRPPIIVTGETADEYVYPDPVTPSDLDAALVGKINDTSSGTNAALSATYANYANLAKNPDTIIAGAVTVDATDLVMSAAVVWPDGKPGTMTITSRDANNAVTAYNITYGSPVIKTFTQPTITRNTNGAATNVPQIVVS